MRILQNLAAGANLHLPAPPTPTSSARTCLCRRYTLIGIELDWVWALGLEPDTMEPPLEDFVSHLSSFGFNHALVSFYANFSGWNAHLPDRVAPKVSPTLNTPWDTAAFTDQTRLNLHFYQHWDTVLHTLGEHGMVSHTMLTVGNKNVNYPAENSKADDTFWRYTLARYNAFPSWLVDVSKEAGSYDVPADYVLERLRLIHSTNAHGRIVTSHSGMHWSNKCDNLPVTMCSTQVRRRGEDGRGGSPPPLAAEPPPLALFRLSVCALALFALFALLFSSFPRFVCFAFCVLRLCACAPVRAALACRQEHSTNHTSDSWYDQITATRKANPGIPVSNVEFMYESAPVAGCSGSCCKDCTSGGAADVSAMRVAMWDMYLAGASGAWYWCDTAWDIITMGTSQGYHYCAHLASFLKTVAQLVAMEPHDELLKVDDASSGVIGHALAMPGVEYVVHLREAAAAFSIQIAGVSGALGGEWVDPVTGRSVALAAPLANGVHKLTAPAEFVLHLH